MTKYYKIKYSCGCEYEGHFPSSPRCPSDHYSVIVEQKIIITLAGQLEPVVINFLPTMKMCYGIGRYTNASRPAIRHISDNNGLPLCGSRKKFTYETEEGKEEDIDCKKCRQKYL